MPAEAPITRRPWSGALRIGAGGALWVGRATLTDQHAHHAHQICLALEAPLAIRDSGRWRSFDAAVIPADAEHEIDAGGHAVALLFVEPESAAGRGLGPTRRVDALDAELAARLRGQVRRADALERMLRLLQPNEGAVALDARLERALAILRQARGEYPPSSVVARRVASSVGRFRHLFREQIGLGYRTYLLWLRLGDALAMIAAGASLTEAAHAAGFADSAHLSRTYRRMFGLTPSILRRS